MYFNTLIIMNEDTPGYGKRSRSPSGYCKLTMPNRIICYVQGLQQLPKGQIYRLYLMSETKQQSVEVGMLQVGANGNKETRWVINPDNINNSGISARDIDGALIMVDGEGIKKHTVPLIGFSSENYTWVHLMNIGRETPPKETKIASAQMQPTPPVVQPTPVMQPTPPVVEPTPAMQPTPPVVEPTPVEEPAPVVEPTPAMQPTPPVVEPTPVMQPTPPVMEPTPVMQPTPPVMEPTPVEEPPPVVQPTPPVMEPTPAEEPMPPMGITPTEPIQTQIIGAPLEPDDLPQLNNRRKTGNVISNIIDEVMVEEILSLKGEIERLNRTIESLKRNLDASAEETPGFTIEPRILEPLKPGGPEPLRAKVELASAEVESESQEMESELPRAESELPESLPEPSSKPEPPEIPEKVRGINEYIDNFLRKFQAVDKNAHQVAFRDMQNIFEKRIPINPFEVPNAGIKWVRITHDDLMSFSQLSHEWTNQPFIMDAHRDYKHFILGRDESGIAYYLGIPGAFNPNKKDILNIDKIDRFSCCRNIPPKIGEAGYWIARI